MFGVVNLLFLKSFVLTGHCNFSNAVEGDTSSFECAHQLGKLCENRHLLVNLIPYNQTDVKDKLRCPSKEHMYEFRRIVSSYGTLCTIRKTMGADIASACGQLVISEEKKQDAAHVDIEDGPFRKAEAKCSTEVASFGERPKPTKFAAGHSKDHDDSARWIKPLMIATTIMASCFVVSSTLFLSQNRRR